MAEVSMEISLSMVAKTMVRDEDGLSRYGVTGMTRGAKSRRIEGRYKYLWYSLANLPAMSSECFADSETQMRRLEWARNEVKSRREVCNKNAASLFRPADERASRRGEHKQKSCLRFCGVHRACHITVCPQDSAGIDREEQRERQGLWRLKRVRPTTWGGSVI